MRVSTLCEKIGVKRASYYAWIDGRAIPTPEHQAAIARVCRVPLDYFNPEMKDKYDDVPQTGRKSSSETPDKTADNGLHYLGPDKDGLMLVTFARRVTPFQMNKLLKFVSENFADADEFAD